MTSKQVFQGLVAFAAASACDPQKPIELAENAQPVIDDHVGHWRFDETGGVIAADELTTPGHDGMLYEGPNIDKGPTWTLPGRIVGAITFDGYNDHVQIPDHDFNSSFTVAFWFKVNNNTGGRATLYSHGVPYTPNSLLVRMTGVGNGEVWTYFCAGHDTHCTTGWGARKPSRETFADGAWHHYALTVGKTTTIYLDGEPVVAEVPRGGSTFDPSGDIYLGMRSDLTSPFDGALDELYHFDRPLDEAEVLELVNDGPNPPGDTTSPTVAMTSPIAGTTQSGNFDLVASAKDDAGVVGVTFLMDRSPVSPEITSPPYTFTINAATLHAGARTFSARARDAAGNLRTSTGVSVIISSTIGAVSMTPVTNFPIWTGRILNPERGFHPTVHIDREPHDLSDVRADGYTLVRDTIDLRELMTDTTPIPQTILDNLAANFQTLRDAGIKIILRFAYRQQNPNIDDPDLSRVLGHITQVADLLAEFSDVIAVVQAGWIGPYGEFNADPGHNGCAIITNGTWPQVVQRMLETLPESRYMQLRTPVFKDNFEVTNGNTDHQPLRASEAFGGGAEARLGHFNDCFLSSTDDTGTYPNPIPTWQQYVKDESQYMPFGGETCGNVNNPGNRLHCVDAQPELRSMHTSYLNVEWAPNIPTPVTGLWATEQCWDSIERNLGYRLAIMHVEHSTSVKPGNYNLELEVELRNLGYAAPYSTRPVYVVLYNATGKWIAKLEGDDVDPRRWYSGTSRTFARKLLLSNDITVGTYTLALWLPDDAETSIHTDPRYAIRFAHKPMAWDAVHGFNILTNNFQVSMTADNNKGPWDTEFVACTPSTCP